MGWDGRGGLEWLSMDVRRKPWDRLCFEGLSSI
jgi:hypothetical protein